MNWAELSRRDFGSLTALDPNQRIHRYNIILREEPISYLSSDLVTSLQTRATQELDHFNRLQLDGEIQSRASNSDSEWMIPLKPILHRCLRGASSWWRQLEFDQEHS